MAEQKPQNPTFRVDMRTLDTCLPKVLCPQCGTIVALRNSRRTNHVKCPSCAATFTLECREGTWQGLIAEAE